MGMLCRKSPSIPLLQRGKTTQDASTPLTIPPFEKGGLGGISLQAHIEAAAKLITETGYHRRDKELLELQQILAAQ